jgi:hypothetical protein
VTHNKPELLVFSAAMNENGLTLPNLSTKSNVKPRAEIAKLSELDEIKNDVELHKLCKDTEELCNAGKVMEDMDLIASKSAVMTTEFVKFHFATLGHVGQVTEDKKSVQDSKSKSMEQISNAAAPRRHHGCAVKDAIARFLITTQSASLGKDHGSKKKQSSQEPQQQQADPKQCIHLVEFSAMPTSATDGDDHDFGVVNAVRRRWCACKAGNGVNDGECAHDGVAADHQGNDSATAGTKKWKHRGADRPRTCDPTKPFRHMTFERLGRSRAAAHQRSCHEERHELHCDILSPKDVALFNERVTKETLFPFCGALQASRLGLFLGPGRVLGLGMQDFTKSDENATGGVAHFQALFPLSLQWPKSFFQTPLSILVFTMLFQKMPTGEPRPKIIPREEPEFRFGRNLQGLAPLVFKG